MTDKTETPKTLLLIDDDPRGRAEHATELTTYFQSRNIAVTILEADDAPGAAAIIGKMADKDPAAKIDFIITDKAMSSNSRMPPGWARAGQTMAEEIRSGTFLNEQEQRAPWLSSVPIVIASGSPSYGTSQTNDLRTKLVSVSVFGILSLPEERLEHGEKEILRSFTSFVDNTIGYTGRVNN